MDGIAAALREYRKKAVDLGRQCVPLSVDQCDAAGVHEPQGGFRIPFADPGGTVEVCVEILDDEAGLAEMRHGTQRNDEMAGGLDRLGDVGCSGDEDAAAGCAGGAQTSFDDGRQGRVAQPPTEEDSAPLSSMFDLAQAPQRCRNHLFMLIPSRKAQGRGEPPDDARDVHPEPCHLITGQIHPAAVRAVPLAASLLEANPLQIAHSAPGTEDARSDTITRPDGAEVEEMPISIHLSGIPGGIRMEASLGFLDEPAEQAEGDVVARLHGGFYATRASSTSVGSETRQARRRRSASLASSSAMSWRLEIPDCLRSMFSTRPRLPISAGAK